MVAVTQAQKRSGRKRAHGEGTIRQRPSRNGKPGLWEAQLLLPNGTRHSVYGKTQREALEKLRELRARIEQGVAVGTRQQTVAQFLTEWLENVVRVGNAHKTYVSYGEQIRKHIIPGVGKHRLDRLTSQHIQAFINRQSGTKLSARTVRYQRDILRIALNKAVEYRLIPSNLAVAVKPPRLERRQVRALSLDEVKAIMDAFQGTRLGTLVRTALMLGLRRGELLGLRWQDVDPEGAAFTPGEPEAMGPQGRCRRGRQRRPASTPAATAPPTGTGALRDRVHHGFGASGSEETRHLRSATLSLTLTLTLTHTSLGMSCWTYCQLQGPG
jgi:hypothetical protein